MATVARLKLHLGGFIECECTTCPSVFAKRISLGAFVEFRARVCEQSNWQVGHGESIDAGRIPAHFFDWYLALQKHTDTMKHEGAMIGNAGTFFGGFSPVLTISDDLLRSVQVSTLFYCGQGEDALGGGAPVVGPMAGAMPDAELVMALGAGHLPWLDDPQASAQATLEFLRRF